MLRPSSVKLAVVALVVGWLAMPDAEAWGVYEPRIERKGHFLVYRADQELDGRSELYEAIPGFGANGLKMNGPLVAGGGVNEFEIDPKGRGRFVVYRADQEVDDTFELFAMDRKTGLVSKLNGALPTDGDVHSFEIGAKGRFVVYGADQDTEGVNELFALDRRTGEIFKLNAALGLGEVRGFGIDPKSRYVVYRAREAAGPHELFRVERKSGTLTKLNNPLGAGESVDSGFQIEPRKGRFVVYRLAEGLVESRKLYEADRKSGAIVQRNAPLGPEGRLFRFAIDPKGRSIAYLASEDADGPIELYRTDRKTGEVSRLSEVLVAGGDVVGFRIGPKGRFAVYLADQETDERFELYEVDLKTGSVAKLSQPLEVGGSVELGFEIGRKGRFVFYRATPDGSEDVTELYRVDRKTREVRKLNDPLVAGGGDVLGFQLDPKGRFVLYEADQEEDEVIELYGVDQKTGAVTKLNAGLVAGGDVSFK